MGSWLELGVGLRIPDQLGSRPKFRHCQAATLQQAPAKPATRLVDQRLT